MTKLNSLFLLLAMFLAVSCNMSAKNENKNKEKANIEVTTDTSVKNVVGEVVMLDKANFLTKVFNYEKNAQEWVYEGNKPCIIDFYADWCGPCKKNCPGIEQSGKRIF